MILLPTSSGHRAFQRRDALLAPTMRTVFMLCDGQRSMAQVVAATAGLGATADDVHALLDLGWLQPAAVRVLAAHSARAEGAAEVSRTPHAPCTLQARYREGYHWARLLTGSLGFKGLRLHWAVEAAADYGQLAQLVPRIREAVGAAKVSALELVLFGGMAEQGAAVQRQPIAEQR